MRAAECGYGPSQYEVAEELGVSRARVKQLEQAGLRRMRGATLEPDVIRLPTPLAALLDRVLEREQCRTGEPAHEIRKRHRDQILDVVRAWAIQKEGEK